MESVDLTKPGDAERAEIERLIARLSGIRDDLVKLESAFSPVVKDIEPTFRKSAINLIHYVALRQHDIRDLQISLAQLGLSSLGRTESHVYASLNAVLGLLRRLTGDSSPDNGHALVPKFHEGRQALERHTNGLLGEPPMSRAVRIMVTMPSAAAAGGHVLDDMATSGMDCVRINCAHDDSESWLAIIDHLRRMQQETGRRFRVLMDLAGPKLRTGPVAEGPTVLKCRPTRDACGRVIAPARMRLVAEMACLAQGGPEDSEVCVRDDLIACLADGDVLAFTDARNAHRTLVVSDRHETGFWAETEGTCYLVPGTVMKLSARADGLLLPSIESQIVGVPRSRQMIRLRRGDILHVTREPIPGEPAQFGDAGKLVRPAHISCSVPEIYTDARPGERMLFDDGRIGGVIKRVDSHCITVEITRAREGGDKLLADKGINLPDSTLHLPALTRKDIQDLEFAVRHADMVGLSFVQDVSDVRLLQAEFARLGRPEMPVVLKIETRSGFDRLPELLLAAMASPTVGVMIARGDLAVECGYERLAEIQEEILWLCEAAHVPVIWATQVLERLAKSALPSRAEITDAAMGERAECVMLNKGPHIVDAIRTLDDILSRMQGHQHKKSPTLRRLNAWNREPAPYSGSLPQVVSSSG